MIEQAVPPEARRTCAHLHEVFAEMLVAIYLFGSAVHDGLRPDSDIDLLVVIAGRSTREQRQALLERLLQSSGRIGNSAALRPLELSLLGIDDWSHAGAPLAALVRRMRQALESGLAR